VNPDRGLRKVAAERGWPVLEFNRPVSLRTRFSGARTPVVTSAAVGAAVAGLAWYARRRSLRALPGGAAGAVLPAALPPANRGRRRGA
jgi:hypothetical protein